MKNQILAKLTSADAQCGLPCSLASARSTMSINLKHTCCRLAWSPRKELPFLVQETSTPEASEGKRTGNRRERGGRDGGVQVSINMTQCTRMEAEVLGMKAYRYRSRMTHSSTMKAKMLRHFCGMMTGTSPVPFRSKGQTESTTNLSFTSITFWARKKCHIVP